MTSLLSLCLENDNTYGVLIVVKAIISDGCFVSDHLEEF